MHAQRVPRDRRHMRKVAINHSGRVSIQGFAVILAYCHLFQFLFKFAIWGYSGILFYLFSFFIKPSTGTYTQRVHHHNCQSIASVFHIIREIRILDTCKSMSDIDCNTCFWLAYNAHMQCISSRIQICPNDIILSNVDIVSAMCYMRASRFFVAIWSVLVLSFTMRFTNKS